MLRLNRSFLPLGNGYLLSLRAGDRAMTDQRKAQRESTYKAARIGTGSRAAKHC